MKKILVVDDDKDLRYLLKTNLGESGYHVITAENGEEGLQKAKEVVPDLILLDIQMPGKDGGEVSAELKKDPKTKNIPIIFLTALRQREEEKKQGLIIGDNIVFAKPFRLQAVLDKIQEIFQG